MNGGIIALMNYGRVHIESTTLSDSLGISGLVVSMIKYGEIYCKNIVITNCYGY